MRSTTPGPATRLHRLAAGICVAGLLIAGAACGGGSGESASPGGTDATTATASTTASDAGTGGCPSAADVSADLGIPGLATSDVTSPPTPTTTLTCVWTAGTVGEDGGATVRFAVDEPGDAETARSGFEFSRDTMGSCVRTDSCEAGDDVADDVFTQADDSFVTSDVSTLNGAAGDFFTTVIIAAVNDGDANCSLAVNLGATDRADVLAPVRPAGDAVREYCARRSD